MAGQRGRRQRAVRLTDEALEVLNKGLSEQWNSLNLEGRLTQEVRATLLEVSVGTAERIVARRGNDRTVLEHAFRSVELKWHDHYAEPMPVERGAVETRSGSATPMRIPTSRILSALVGALSIFSTVLLVGYVLNRNPREQTSPMNVINSGRTSYHAGDYATAKKLVGSAIGRAHYDKHAKTMAEALRLEGELRAAEGDLTAAIDAFDRALVIHDAFNHSWARASLLEVLGSAEIRLGKHSEAAQHLEESLAGLEKHGDFRGVASTLRSQGTLFAAMGNPEAARERFANAEQAMTREPDPNLLVDMKAQRAILDSRDGHAARALKELQECLQHWMKLGHKRWIAVTQLQIAQVHQAAGNRDRAHKAARQALSNYLLVGDRFGADLCDKLIRS